MNPISNAVLKTGIVSKETLAEFKRWKTPIEFPIERIPDKPPETVEEAAQAIEEALQSEGYVLTRETDLEVLQQYLTTQRTGRLHVEVLSQDPMIRNFADIPVVYGMTPMGEYIIPWNSETVAAEISNGISFLMNFETGEKVFFKDVRELFFGEHKAFMVCVPNPDIRDVTPALGNGENDVGNIP